MYFITAEEVALRTGDESVLLADLPPTAKFELGEVRLSSLEIMDKQHPARLQSLMALPVDRWNPLVVWDEVIIDGSHRVALARDMGLLNLPAYLVKEM